MHSKRKSNAAQDADADQSPTPKRGAEPLGEYDRRATEFDRFRIETLLPAKRFAATVATDEETLRLGNSSDLAEVGAKSVTIMLQLAGTCAGWKKPPTGEEFHIAVRARRPNARQRAILGAFAQEVGLHDLIAAWAERAFTIRELVAALHRSGRARCRAARWINGWAR